MKPIQVVTVYTIGCGAQLSSRVCCYIASALHQESAKTSMLEHLIYAHGPQELSSVSAR